VYFGKLNVCAVASNYLWYRVHESLFPRDEIDIAPDWTIGVHCS